MDNNETPKENNESKLKLITVYIICSLSIIGICVKGYFVFKKSNEKINNIKANNANIDKRISEEQKNEKECIAKYKKIVSWNNNTIEKINSVIISINNNFSGEKTKKITDGLELIKKNLNTYNLTLDRAITVTENKTGQLSEDTINSCEISYRDNKELTEYNDKFLQEYKNAILPTKRQALEDQKAGICKTEQDCKKYEDNLLQLNINKIDNNNANIVPKWLFDTKYIMNITNEYINQNREDYIQKNESRPTHPNTEELACYKKIEELKNNILKTDRQFEGLKTNLNKNNLENGLAKVANLNIYTAINYQKEKLLPTIEEILSHKINNTKLANCEKEISQDISISLKISKDIVKINGNIEAANKNISKYCKILDCKTEEDTKTLKDTLFTYNPTDNQSSDLLIDTKTIEILSKLINNRINESEKAKQCSQLATSTIEKFRKYNISLEENINTTPDNYITGENYKIIKLYLNRYNNMVGNTIMHYLQKLSDRYIAINEEKTCLNFLETFNDYINIIDKINNEDKEQHSETLNLITYAKTKYNCSNLSDINLNCYKANMVLLSRLPYETSNNKEKEQLGEKILKSK